MHYRSSNIGAELKTYAGVAPIATDTEQNGSAVDRMGKYSGVLAVQCGAATGSPTAQSVSAKVQHGPTSTGPWADLEGAGTAALSADNGLASVNVDLTPADRYIRTVVAVSLTGGTTPAIPVSATMTIGGSDTNPPA